MKKQILSILLALGLTASLAACGGTTEQGAPAGSAAPDGGAGQSGTAGGKVKFAMWHSYVGADQRAGVMEKLMTEFRGLHPEYEIDEQKIPRDQYQTKLKTQAAAGQLPDVFLSWPNAMCQEFAEAGLLADINGLLDANPDWKNSLVERSFDEYTFDGKTYSVGMGVSMTSLVFYNQALFDEHGVAYPAAFEELKAACKTFLDAGVIPIAHGNKPKWPMQSTILSCMANRETGSEWLYGVIDGSGPKFTDPEFVKALADIKELVDIGAFNKDYISIDNVQMRDYFYQGKAAMMIDGSWALPDILQKAPEELKADIKVGVLPAIEGGKGEPNAVSGVAGTGFVINAKASPEQKKAAEALILFLTQPSAQDLYVRDGVVPSAKETTVPESEIDPVFQQMLKILAESPLVSVYDSALSSEQADVINNGLQALTIGDRTPEEVAQELQDAM